MIKVVLASQNKHKLEEIDQITREFGFQLISRDEAGIPKDFDVVEDGDTFEENSYKKAKAIADLSGMITIADDSGLMVDYLNGDPGVHSARYAGDGHDDQANNKKLMKELENVPLEDRKAAFVSVITMVFPDGEKIVAKGVCKGHIADEPQGENGFGYDPLFIPTGYNDSFAALGSDVKNNISHRALALMELKKQLKNISDMSW